MNDPGYWIEMETGQRIRYVGGGQPDGSGRRQAGGGMGFGQDDPRPQEANPGHKGGGHPAGKDGDHELEDLFGGNGHGLPSGLR